LWDAVGDTGPDPTEVAYTSIRTMTSTLNEAHTQFYTPAMYQAEVASSSGDEQYEGIGARLSGSPLTIESVFPVSPAEAAGLRAGDQIVMIDGQPSLDLSPEDAVTLVRGEAGTTVTLEVRRATATTTMTISIVRAAISVPIVLSDFMDGAGYIRITSF